MPLENLNALVSIHSEIKEVHPSLNKLYPIAITDVVDNKLIIYDVNSSMKYEYVTEKKVDIPLPKKVRASFPIDFYDSKGCCVVSEDIFEENDAFVTFFHEFVHCYQYEYCEREIKESLSIAKRYDNAYWELEHPFPYDSQLFEKSYESINKSAESGDSKKLRQLFSELKSELEKYDYEYMIWQIWKEGFARFIENNIREKYNLPKNTGGKTPPYNRVSLYYMGDQLISYLDKTNSEVVRDIRTLFDVLYNYKY